MSDPTALARSLLVWLVPFAIVVAALGFETDWGRAVSQDAPAPPAMPHASPGDPRSGATAAGGHAATERRR